MMFYAIFAELRRANVYAYESAPLFNKIRATKNEAQYNLPQYASLLLKRIHISLSIKASYDVQSGICISRGSEEKLKLYTGLYQGFKRELHQTLTV